MNRKKICLRLTESIEEGLSRMKIPDKGRSKLRVSGSVYQAIAGVGKTQRPVVIGVIASVCFGNEDKGL